jgi:hypothetical protein
MTGDPNVSARASWTLLLAASTLGCHAEGVQEASTPADDVAAESMPAGTESLSATAETPPAPSSEATPVNGMITGTVVETMDAGGYTYVRVDSGSGLAWAAGPPVSVAPGDRLRFDASMPMSGYHSASLDRTFARIYFTSALETLGGEPAAAAAAADPATFAGRVSVGDVFARRDELVGSEIEVRGEVVKFNAGIMGTNWLHLQDGTGSEGTDDLTVTSDATVTVGDTVVIRGVLVADRDFGYGYVYDLIVEGAAVTRE